MEWFPAAVCPRKEPFSSSCHVCSMNSSMAAALCCLLVSSFILSTVEGDSQVIGGNVTVVLGGTAVLPCKLIHTTEALTQISWRKEPETENFFAIVPGGPTFVNKVDDRFKFIGNFSAYNGTLQLSNVALMDESTYVCIFILFPSGNMKTEVPLNVLVPPVMSLKDNRPVLGNEEVSLVTCMAAGSKPPAQVRWLTGTLEGKVRAITNFTQEANGTTTTVSSLFGIPTRDLSHHLVQCIITSAAMLKEESLPFTIQIYFPPADVNIIVRSADSFECVTKAKPNADFNWSRSNQPWPQSAVRVDGATLKFLRMTSELNGLYQCEASNLYGIKRGNLYLHVTAGTCIACWILLGLLSSMIACGVIALCYFYKSGKFQRFIGGPLSRSGEHTHGERKPVPTTSRTSEEAQRIEVEADILLQVEGSV